jgi:hypothetical protein
MSTATAKDWRKDFGVEGRQPPSLFTSKDQMTPTTPQAHLLRRAFESLEVDGVLCADHSPLIYFKQLDRITADAVYKIHKQFWNHGGAPVLVLISEAEVHIYSGMSRPGQNPPSGSAQLPSHIETLNRVSETLRMFLTSVESGEYFHRHHNSFNPAQRVDRDLLENLQTTCEKLQTIPRQRISVQMLDALLCRLVFTCYLFDRQVIDASYLDALGIRSAGHLRDVLAIQPSSKAKSSLYKLFEKLRKDFNGDLFSNDLRAEANDVLDDHIQTLRDFFHGTSVRSGQGSFWPYDFAFIPIETISAIYERFLKEADEKVGAFYTPRFLAEVVLDITLAHMPTLLGKRSLDPACGSGIFLVGLFNRIAEEWKQANPKARNDTKAKELMRLLQTHIFGIDVKETACRITAFSLYLAYLDQLSPRGIQELQEKGRALPRLIVDGGNIQCADFFAEDVAFPSDVDIVIGNPPWGSIATSETAAGKWCVSHDRLLPDKQIAAAFVWKAVEHIKEGGKVCFVLPHGLIFNHSTTAIPFQKAWLRTHAVDCVLNLADLRFFLFEKAIHPAIVVRYQKAAPKDGNHLISYWAPKSDWTVTKTEVITIAPQDRVTFKVGDVLQDLSGPDAPQIWKQRFWATPRDWRLLDRLATYPRLRDIVRRPREKNSSKSWFMAVGFQPFGDNDPESSRKILTLPSRHFIPATSQALDLFVLEGDCDTLPSKQVEVRRLMQTPQVFRGPHVLMAKGMTSTAFADFDVSFQDAVRGVHGPDKDRDLLIFLSAYLRSGIAKYYLFHTSANWGIYRPEVHVEEVLRVPFPLPDQQPNPRRCSEIVREVANIVTKAAKDADADFVDRPGIIRNASANIEPLVEEYFDVLPLEKLLIEDTLKVIIKSIQPTQGQLPVETVKVSTSAQRQAYCVRVCEMLNGWAKRGKYSIRGTTLASDAMGVGLAVFEKVERRNANVPMSGIAIDVLTALDALRKAAPQKHNTLDLVRGVMAFSGNLLHVVKPIGQRQWTQTAAMNDADEIAGTILMQPPQEEV